MDKYNNINETVHNIELEINNTFCITDEKDQLNKNIELSKKSLLDIKKQLELDIPEHERPSHLEFKIQTWRENLNNAIENISNLVNTINERLAHLPTDKDIATGIQNLFKTADRLHKKQYLIYNKEFDAFEERINIIANNLNIIESQETENLLILKDLKDDIENQIRNQNEIVNQISDSIKNQNNSYNHVNTTNRFSTSTLNNSIISHNTNAKPPIFSDNETDQPLRFLKDFKIYVEMFNISNTTDLIFTLKKCLLGKAKTWLHVVQDDITTLETFENQFKQSYWNKNVQNNVKWRITNGKYSKDGKMTRVQYATNIFAIAQDLGLAEDQIIPELKNHFEREIKIHIRNTTSRIDLFDILAEFDNDEHQTKKKSVSFKENSDQKFYNNNSNNNKYNQTNNTTSKNNPPNRSNANISNTYRQNQMIKNKPSENSNSRKQPKNNNNSFNTDRPRRSREFRNSRNSDSDADINAIQLIDSQIITNADIHENSDSEN